MSSDGPYYTAIVLAGDRGADDPVAAWARRPHKAMVDVAGAPMLARVIAALRGCRGVSRIAVVTPPDGLVEAEPRIAAEIEAAGARVIAARETPARSALDAIERLGADGGFLITTADHALLTSAMTSRFLAEAQNTAADVCVGLAHESVIRAAYPDVARTYLPFRDGGWSGCNLFAVKAPRGVAAVRFWRRAEADRKRPWRLARHFGIVNLLLFATRQLTLQAAIARAGAAADCTVAAIAMAEAEAAIDVDKTADLRLAEEILRNRR